MAPHMRVSKDDQITYRSRRTPFQFLSNPYTIGTELASNVMSFIILSDLEGHWLIFWPPHLGIPINPVEPSFGFILYLLVHLTLNPKP